MITPSRPSAISIALVILNPFNEIFCVLLKLKCFNQIVSDPRDNSGTNEKSGRVIERQVTREEKRKGVKTVDTNRNDSHTFHAAGS